VERLALALAVLGLVTLATAAFRRRRAGRSLPARIEPADFHLDGAVGAATVVFTSPYCHACQEWLRELDAARVPVHRVNVATHAVLAGRYEINATPAVLSVELPSGRVLAAYDDGPTPGAVAEVVRLAGVAVPTAAG